MKISKSRLKELVRETMIEENEYKDFFQKALEKAGKSIPEMSDEEKKSFFNKVDAAWKAKGEKKEVSEAELSSKPNPKLYKRVEDKLKRQKYNSDAEWHLQLLKGMNPKKLTRSDLDTLQDFDDMYESINEDDTDYPDIFKKGSYWPGLSNKDKKGIYIQKTDDGKWRTVPHKLTGVSHWPRKRYNSEADARKYAEKQAKNYKVPIFRESVNEDDCGCGGNQVNEAKVINVGNHKYTNADIDEFLSDIDMYLDADNLPGWLHRTAVKHPAILGKEYAKHKSHAKLKQGIINLLKKIKAHPGKVTIDLHYKTKPWNRKVVFESITEDGKLQGGGDDPCWKGYEMVGMKKGKGGKDVPNCVPKNENINEDTIDKILANKGYGPVLQAIAKSKSDFKRLGYSKGEIEDTLYNMFGKKDPKIVKAIKEVVNEDCGCGGNEDCGCGGNKVNEAMKKLKKPLELGQGKKGVYYLHKVGHDTNGNWSYIVSRGSNKPKKIQHQGQWREKLTTSHSDEDVFNSDTAEEIIKYYEKFVNESVNEGKRAVYLQQVADGTWKVSADLGNDKDLPKTFNDTFTDEKRARKFADKIARNYKVKLTTSPSLVNWHGKNEINMKKESINEESEYKTFFKKALEKTGKDKITSMSDEEKKAFFNKVDAAWKAKGEKKENIEEAGKLKKAKRFSKDLAYDLGHQDLRQPDEFEEYNQLDRKGQTRAWSLWRFNIAQEQ
jgi:hypothetical protein